MKKKIVLIVAALAVFGLSIAVVAYNRTTSGNAAKATADCCKGKDSCPLKKNGAHEHKAGDHAEKADACDNCGCDCCKDGGESCPMKSAKAKANAEAVAAPAEAVTAVADPKEKNGCGCGCACCAGAKSEDKASV